MARLHDCQRRVYSCIFEEIPANSSTYHTTNFWKLLKNTHGFCTLYRALPRLISISDDVIPKLVSRTTLSSSMLIIASSQLKLQSRKGVGTILQRTGTSSNIRIHPKTSKAYPNRIITTHNIIIYTATTSSMINHTMVYKAIKHRKSFWISASIFLSAMVSTSLPVVISFAPLDLQSRERLATTYRSARRPKSRLVSSTWEKSTSIGKATPFAIPIPSPTSKSQVKLPRWESVRKINGESKVDYSPYRFATSQLNVGTVLSVGATVVPALGVATVANGLDLFSSSTWSGFQGASIDEIAVSSTISPVVEGEIFSGLAHVALDLLTLAGPATIVVRLGAVVGRMLSMAADYIPDHNVVPQELVFQCLMLCIAWFALVQSLIPVALSTFAYNINASNIMTSNTDSSKAQRLRDAKAYSMFFKSAGLSWNHFKAMSACAFEWISVAPGDVISTNEINASTRNGKSEEDEHVYWLYNGTVNIQSQGKPVQDLQHSCRQRSSNSIENAGCCMLFENRLLNKILEKDCTNTKKRGKDTSSCDDSKDKKSSNTKGMTLLATGSSNSLLLRINTSKLLMLMETDPQLSNSIRSLLMNSMQAKLNAQLSAAQ